MTATRVILTGPFALALKKHAGGTTFLTIEGPGFAWVEEVDRKKRAKAMQFIAAVKAQVSSMSAGETTAVEAPSKPQVSATAAPPPPDVPAGWYTVGDVQRYWDGTQWTHHTAPVAP